MEDCIVKIDIKHKPKFLEVIEKLDEFSKFRYHILEKMNGNITINFVSDMDKLLSILPEERDFFNRINQIIKVKRVFAPKRIVVKFIEKG